jgi:hypothetical protein
MSSVLRSFGVYWIPKCQQAFNLGPAAVLRGSLYCAFIMN